jgi:hypothetical protein
MSSNQRQSPYVPPLTTGTDQSEDPFQQMGPPSFVPSSTSSDGTWDDYIAWDSLKSPIDFQLGLPTHTPQDQSTAPPFDEAFESWTRSQDPKSFSPAMPSNARTNSDLFAPNRASSATQDALGDYLLTSGSSYPSLLAEPVLDPSQLTPMPAELQDSGFASRSTSYIGRPSLDLILPRTRSGTESPHDSGTKSPVKRRTSATSSTNSQATDFKKPRKNKPNSHNDVEKRYRSKLNTMIVELSNSVPSLRSATASENPSGDEMDVEVGTKSGYPSKGLKKATILGKATEYIKSLEGEVKSLGEENRALKRRLGLVGRIAGEEALK